MNSLSTLRRAALRASAVLTFALSLSAPVVASQVIGTLEYLEGDVLITRGGEELPPAAIGDAVESFDLIRTGDASVAVISLDGSVGMSGTISMKPKSVCSLDSQVSGGGQTTTADLLAGSLSVKVKRLAGTPSLDVRTSGATMGVRGTEFEVAVAVTGSLLVSCSEGRVACSAEEGDVLDAVPGQAVERAEGEKLRSVPVAVSDLGSFRERWATGERELFRRNALRMVRRDAVAYERMSGDFKRAFGALARDQNLAEWLKERRSGALANPRDPRTMRQMSVVVKKLMAVRRVQFLFERNYYRLLEARDYLSPEDMSAELAGGRSVADFYRALDLAGAELRSQVAAYRLALSLYAERGGSQDLFGDGDGGSFFDEDDSFFD